MDGVVVVVPARDEADNLRRLLPSLPEGVDVVVVDDGSSDATAVVARDLGASVIVAEPPPEGWTGKAWACWTGSQSDVASAAERLVFLDADVVVEPGGLEAVVAEQARRGGLVSVQPWHDVRRTHEQLSALFNLIAPMSVDAFTPLPPRPTGAFGPCLAIDRSTYERSGGHGAQRVRGAVLDDVQLARAVRDVGGDVHVFAGRHTGLRFRMYPRGLGQLAEGWTKNFAGGAAGTRLLTLVLVVLWLSGPIAAVFRPGPFGLVYVAYAAQLAVQLRRVGRFSPVTAALYPVPLAFFVAVFARSLVRTYVRRQVTWRGRTIST